MILSKNPGVDPYNLQIGSTVIICPGENFVSHAPDPARRTHSDYSKQSALRESMRLAWEQHVYWTRMLIISIAERLKDQSAVTARLLENPNDIAGIFARYYPKEVARKIAQLLTEHLQIGAALITALRDDKAAEADSLNHKWYINADQMAHAFNSVNPYYKYDELREMLYTHLKLTTQEVQMRLAGRYKDDIAAFDKVEKEALMMADAFTSGLMKQFPQDFY